MRATDVARRVIRPPVVCTNYDTIGADERTDLRGSTGPYASPCGRRGDVRSAWRRDPRFPGGRAPGGHPFRPHAARSDRRIHGRCHRTDPTPSGRLCLDARSRGSQHDAWRCQRLSRSISARRHHRLPVEQLRALRYAPASRPERRLPTIHQTDRAAGWSRHRGEGTASAGRIDGASHGSGAHRAAERRRTLALARIGRDGGERSSSPDAARTAQRHRARSRPRCPLPAGR